MSRVGWSHPLFVTTRNRISSLALNLTTFRSIDQQQVENSERGHVYRLRDKVVNAMLSLVIFTMFISGSESVKRDEGVLVH